MFYALIDTSSYAYGTTSLAWGEDLNSVAEKIISECDLIINSFGEDSLEDLKEKHHCVLNAYLKLKNSDNVTADLLNRFIFRVNDCSVEVEGIVDGYAELVNAFKEYVECRPTLFGWELAPEFEETLENLYGLDDELRSLNNDEYEPDDYEFLIEVEEDDD